MKILVTGATGYVGHSLTLALAGEGHEVNVLVRNMTSPSIPRHERVTVFKGDLADKSTLQQATKGCDIVFHVAAMVRLYASKPSQFYEINVEGTRNVLDAAMEAGVKKFVFTSTCGVIGPSLSKPMTEADPRITGFGNDYELSKLLAERLVNEYHEKGLFTVITSVAKVYGPGMETHALSVNGLIKRFISGGITFCPTPVGLISNYVFIDDVVRGHILAATSGRAGEKYIIGGENISYHQFFETVRSVTGRKGWLVPISRNLAAIYGGWHFLQHKMRRREPFFSGKGVGQIYCNKSFDCSKARNELAYSITPFETGVGKTIQFLKNNNHEN